MNRKVGSVILQVLCVVLFMAKGYAHKQHVHQYVAREAYSLLKATLGGAEIPDMAAHLGPLEDPSYIGTRQWEKPYITTGAWREDAEDVVFGLKDLADPFPITDGGAISITHFWDADNGDESQNTLRWQWNGSDWQRLTQIENSNIILESGWITSDEAFIVGHDGRQTFVLHGK